MIQTRRILTIDCTERSGDRRRLQYELPARMSAGDWTFIVEQIDKLIGQVSTGMMQRHRQALPPGDRE